MRAISLSLSTIIVLIVLLATLLAVLFFFMGGFGSAGGSIGDISKSATGTLDIDSLANVNDYWFCDTGQWGIYAIGGTEPSNTLGPYPTAEKCRDGMRNNAITDETHQCRCIE